MNPALMTTFMESVESRLKARRTPAHLVAPQRRVIDAASGGRPRAHRRGDLRACIEEDGRSMISEKPPSWSNGSWQAISHEFSVVAARHLRRRGPTTTHTLIRPQAGAKTALFAVLDMGRNRSRISCVKRTRFDQIGPLATGPTAAAHGREEAAKFLQCCAMTYDRRDSA